MMWAMDIEANGLLDTVSVVHCAHFINVKTKETRTFTPESINELCEFMDTTKVLICHNIIGYDLPALEKVFGYQYKGKVVDTLVMSRLLNPKRVLPPNATNRKAGPHSLYAWGVRVGTDKPDHEEWDVFSPEMLHRNIEDVVITLKTYYELIKEMGKDDWGDAMRLTHRLFTNLQKQEEYGWYVDEPFMHRAVSMLQHWSDRIAKSIEPRLPHVVECLEKKTKGVANHLTKPFLQSGKPSKTLYDYAATTDWDIDNLPVSGPFSRVYPRRVDIEKRVELINYLLSIGWIPEAWNINSEGERTSPKLSKDDPFDGIEDKVGSLVARRQQCKHRKSSIEGLIKLIREDGAIPSSVNNMAVTGRMTHRNIVNIPKVDSFFGKWMRKIFIARPGKVLVGADSAGNQLRQFAARMDDPVYTDAVLHGDIHTTNQNLAGLPTRDNAKTFIYGLLFGAGDAKIGRIVNGSSAQGRALRSTFMERLPKYAELIERLVKEWRATAKRRYNHIFRRMEYYDGVIKGLDGRPVTVSSEHQLLVYLLQSDEAIHMSAAYNIAYARLNKKYKWGVQWAFVCFYHDEYTVECDPDIAEDVKHILEQSIVDAGKFYKIPCAHEGDGKIGMNWFDIH